MSREFWNDILAIVGTTAGTAGAWKMAEFGGVLLFAAVLCYGLLIARLRNADTAGGVTRRGRNG